MSENHTPETTSRRRKIQAVLAGGTVLGLGAAVTLANWSDEIFAGAEFETGTFQLEASPALGGPNANWQLGGDADDPAINFSFEPDTVVPDATEYQSLYIRLHEDSTVEGSLDDVVLAEPATGPNASNISYSLYVIGEDEDCAAEGTPEKAVVDGSTLGSGSGGSLPGVELELGEDTEGPNPAVELCYVFDYSEGLEQGTTTEAIWTFNATSDS